MSVTDVLKKMEAETLAISDERLASLIGPAEVRGLWLIYGEEKNGKTWFALQLAKALAEHERVYYVSAEEGMDLSFKMALKRAHITDSRITLYGYHSIADIIEHFKKPKSGRIIFIDNLTIYADELKVSSGIKQLERELPNKLIICIGHEERGKPYPAVAAMCKKMAKVYIHVKGLNAFVVSRFSGHGGEPYPVDFGKVEELWGAGSEKRKVKNEKTTQKI